MIDKLLINSIDEIVSGISFDKANQAFTCLVCGKVFEIGEVFPIRGRFYEASKAVQIHISEEHEEMFNILTSYDKKYMGITDNQKELLKMMYKGLTDKEIAHKTGVSAATIRHQRFVFREKAKQAKLYLSIFDIVDKAVSNKKGKNSSDEIVDIHDNAKMVDERYFITKAEEDKILAAAFESLNPLKLKAFSPKEKKKIVILRKIASQFEQGRHYSEKEINSIIKEVFEDYATIRRYLIEYGFMERTKDCKEYWIK